MSFMKQALRPLVRNPWLTAILLVPLSGGLGISLAVFLVVDAVVLEPLPYKEPKQIHFVWATKEMDRRQGLTPQFVWHLQERFQQFAEIGAFVKSESVSLSDVGSRVSAAYVEPSLLRLLGTSVDVGRWFVKNEGKNVAVISSGLWKDRYGATPNLDSIEMHIGSTRYRVIGVMPQKFFFPDPSTAIWLPLSDNPVSRGQTASVHAVARLTPGVTWGQAQAALDVTTRQWELGLANQQRGAQVGLFSLEDVVLGQFRAGLWTLMAAVCLLTGLAVANVAGVLASRQVERQREISIRIAIGAQRWHLVTDIIGESLWLTGAALVGAIMIGYGTSRWLALLETTEIPRMALASVTWRVAIFALMAWIIAALIFAGVRILAIGSTRSLQALRSTSGVGLPRTSKNLANALTVCQIGLAFILTLGSGMLVQSFANIVQTRWGFDPNQVLFVHVELPARRYASVEEQGPLIQASVEQLRRVPGIVSAAAAEGAPIRWTRSEGANIQTETAPKMATKWSVSPRYFQTLGIRLRGREFSEDDAGSQTPVAILNQSLARILFPHSDPIGREFHLVKVRDNIRQSVISKFGFPPPVARQSEWDAVWDAIRVSPGLWVPEEPMPRRVVGVAEDVRMYSLTDNPTPALYVPLHERGAKAAREIIFLAKTAGAPLGVAGIAQDRIRTIEPSIRFVEVESMQSLVDAASGHRGVSKLLFAVAVLLGSLSILLLLSGIGAAFSFIVANRMSEIGLRMALGASFTKVLHLILSQLLRLLAGGMTLGLLASHWMLRSLQEVLFNVSAGDIRMMAATAALLTTASVLACIPAISKALRLNPVDVLRSE